MSSVFPQETYGVAALCAEVRDLLAQAYSSVWVVGEVERLRPSRRGHLYFELVEKGSGDQIVGKLEAVCWRRDRERLERILRQADQRLEEGQEIRCRANLDFYPPFGRLQLVVREVDPVFTLGQLARRRRETLAQLAAAGLLDENRQLDLPRVPLDLVLITSEGSAAYHDFLTTLQESPYGFRVSVAHAAVQGREAEAELVAALGELSRLAADCAVLVRGGGARTDLAAYDSRPVAEAVARAPVPVLTGLGHQTDDTIADRVAHSAFKTPTKAAEFLVERVRIAEESLLGVREAVARQALEPLRRADRALERARRRLGTAGYRVRSVAERLAGLQQRLRRGGDLVLRRSRARTSEVGARIALSAPRPLRDAGRERRRLADRLAAAAGARLREAAVRVEGNKRLCRQLGIERTLARGFTITRAVGGRVLRAAEGVRPGDRIETVWMDGSRISRVEES